MTVSSYKIIVRNLPKDACRFKKEVEPTGLGSAKGGSIIRALVHYTVSYEFREIVRKVSVLSILGFNL